MDIQNLIQQLSVIAEEGPEGVNEPDRVALLQVATRVREVIENPVEKMTRIMFGVNDAAALRLGVDMGLFDTAVQKSGSISLTELAESRTLDPSLVRRILRVLINLSLFVQKDVDTYFATPLAAAYTSASPLSSAIIHLSSVGLTAAQFPSYFAQNGYKAPEDAYEGGPWHFAHSEGETYFEWLDKHPDEQHAFNITMAAQRMARNEEWFEIFPVEQKLTLRNDEKNRVLFVDVGGNLGHDLKLFHDAFPNLPGGLVLEDLGPVVTTAAKDLPGAILTVGHDFFKPQPDAVRNAKAFYLRMVLHDWPDKQAKVILSNIREVMAPDSILLLNENVLPEMNVPHFLAQLDLHMMSMGALERTEKDWRRILEETGLDVKMVWKPIKDGHTRLSLIEAVVKT